MLTNFFPRVILSRPWEVRGCTVATQRLPLSCPDILTTCASSIIYRVRCTHARPLWSHVRRLQEMLQPRLQTCQLTFAASHHSRQRTNGVNRLLSIAHKLDAGG